MIVQPFHDRRHKDNLQSRLAHVFDAAKFLFPQTLSARALVNVVAHAVELQVQRVQSRGFGGKGKIQIQKANAVGGGLKMRESHLRGHAEDVEKARMQRRLAAGELHDAAGHRALVAQRLQHLSDLLHGRFVKIAGGVGVGETDGTSQIAAVRQIDVRQTGVRSVHGTNPALFRTTRGVGNGGIRDPAIVPEVPALHLQIHLHVRVGDVLDVPVLRTGLLHHHLAVFLKDQRVDQLQTFRTKRLRLPRQAPLRRLDGRSRIRRLGLNDLTRRVGESIRLRLGRGIDDFRLLFDDLSAHAFLLT